MKFRVVFFLFCLASALVPLRSAQFQTLLSVQDSANHWLQTEQHLRPKNQSIGIVFDLAFPAENRRLILERPGRWDLSRATGFRFTAHVERPEHILEGKIHFKSGNGWYSAGYTLNHQGNHHILLPRDKFETEGRPAGWNQIEAIRFSFWPRNAASATVIPLSLEAFTADIQIISGESRAKTGDERYLSRVTLWHMQRILEGIGLPHGITPANELSKLPPAKIIILPYARNLTAGDVEILRNRIRGGTKLIVFESDSSALAELLGVTLGELVSSQTVGMYDRMSFTDSSYPSRVFQHAWSFLRAHPRQGARVLSVWETARGETSRIPAALLPPNGAWFVSSWRSGDLTGKQDTLLALISSWSPGSLLPSVDYHATVLPRPESPANASTPAEHMRKQAGALRSRALEARQRGNYAEALRNLRRMNNLMQRAQAAQHPAWNTPMVGIWDQQGTGFHAGGWDETCRILKAAGFTAVFPNLSSAGRAHYASRLLPGSRTLAQHGDQLQQFTAAARKHGLEAHVWKICWQLKQPDPAFLARMKQEGRLMQDQRGNDLHWLSPSHPDNVQFEIDTLLEILRLAPVDGIHLDYMRYPGRDADYGPAARRAFEAEHGRRLPNWPAEVLGPLAPQFEKFRQQQLHNAMARIHRAVKAEFPRVTLSAAVWGAWPDSAASQGQDWPVWARNGWVDLLMPMNYTDNPYQFAGWLDRQRAQPGVAERLVPGIGVISTNSELDPGQVLQQIAISQSRGGKGVILYRLDTSQPERLFPFLRAGVFSKYLNP
ncbi:MAG: family 10 glycosylhydrolase [Kiritimatiellae bacterium]|nr:family 10 glycosylhydrolase [Kiritimatiellia bacterium]